MSMAELKRSKDEVSKHYFNVSMCIQGEDVLILFSAETPTATKELICTLTCTLEPFTRVRA